MSFNLPETETIRGIYLLLPTSIFTPAQPTAARSFSQTTSHIKAETNITLEPVLVQYSYRGPPDGSTNCIMFDQEKPIILFDSQPDQQGGVIYESLVRFKNHLAVAWTGDVVLDVEPGMVRLQWYTVSISNISFSLLGYWTCSDFQQTDGKFGKRDYELREYNEARQGFEKLSILDDVGRCMILGYPSQNPYSIYGESPFAIKEREKKEILDSARYRDFVPRAKKGPSVAEQIDDILDSEDKKPKSTKDTSKVETQEV